MQDDSPLEKLRPRDPNSPQPVQSAIEIRERLPYSRLQCLGILKALRTMTAIWICCLVKDRY